MVFPGDRKPSSFFQNQLVEIELQGKKQRVIFHYKPDPRTTEDLLKSDEGRALNDILSEFSQLSLANKITPVVVFTPIVAHIYAKYTTPGSGQDWRNDQNQTKASLDHIRGLVKALAESNHIKFIDLVPPFMERAAKGEFLYYPFETHWNSAGRQAAAEYVGSALQGIQ